MINKMVLHLSSFILFVWLVGFCYQQGVLVFSNFPVKRAPDDGVFSKDYNDDNQGNIVWKTISDSIK